METLADTLRTLLAHNIVRFTFRKVDGSIRHAVGTRNLDLARSHTGEYIPTPKGEEQPNSYYDTEKMGWRSYKPELLISIDGATPITNRKPTEREIPIGFGIAEPSAKTAETPIGKGGFDVADFLGGIFGGVGLGGGASVPITPSTPSLKKRSAVGKPEPTESGIAFPIKGEEMDIRDFARLVADLIVENLVARLSR